MDSKKKLHTLLIADSDSAFLEAIRNDSYAQKVPPILVRNGKEAQLALANTDQPLLGVFVNQSLQQPNCSSVLRFSFQRRPSTPRFLLADKEATLTEKELKDLKVQQVIPKPVNYNQLMGLVSNKFDQFDSGKALEASKKYSDALDTEVESEDSEFVPIRAEDFLGGKTSFFDVYVRLGSGRYIKILQAGDSFSLDRISGYREKGVLHFYIRKEVQPQYLAYCEKIAKGLLNLQGEKLSSIKVAQVMNYGQETLNFLKNQGVNPANLQYASEFIVNVQKLTKQLNPGKYPLLNGFLNDVVAYEHAIGVTMLSALLIQGLQITSADPVETVGLAAMFHDIGLLMLGLSALEHDESKMPEFQRKPYRAHPTTGAEFLQTVRGLKPVVIQAVAQHHERRNKKGFPLQIGAGSISTVAEIVGISNDFFHIIQRIQKGEKIDLSIALQDGIFASFSPNIITEFRKVFLISDSRSGQVTKSD